MQSFSCSIVQEEETLLILRNKSMNPTTSTSIAAAAMFYKNDDAICFYNILMKSTDISRFRLQMVNWS